MTKVKKGNRKRAYKPKSSTGCQTCRIRRVKCDEKHPACIRCESTGRTCDGYTPVFQKSQISQQANILVKTSISTAIHASPQAHRSFDFFVHRTRPQLAGFFGSEFWERLVLQAAHHEPAIRHAVVAIGSLHELFENNAPIPQVNRIFALEQYNTAINKLLVPITRKEGRGVDVCLIACILFTCVENMQGHHLSALSHIQSGAKLLGETLLDRRNGSIEHQVLGSKSTAECYVPLESLAKIFSGLGLQDAMMGGVDQFHLHDSPLSDKAANVIPISFSSIEEAKYVFEYGVELFRSHCVAQGSDHSMPASGIDGRMADFSILLSNFSHALEDFMKSKGSSITPKEQIAMDILRLHVLSAKVTLNLELLPPDKRSTEYTGFLPDVQEILDLGENIIASTSTSYIFGRAATSFCLDMGYIIPIYTVASQWQDPTIRRRAIAILRSVPRQEGIWNSILVAKAAERMMELEENTLGGFEACMEYSDKTRTQPFLEIDARGGRLQYFQGGEGSAKGINVVEEIFTG